MFRGLAQPGVFAWKSKLLGGLQFDGILIKIKKHLHQKFGAFCTKLEEEKQRKNLHLKFGVFLLNFFLPP